MLIQAYPKGLAYHKAIFFDTDEGKYYNARTDIYLNADDVKYYNLRPPELVNTDKPLRDDYFVTWDRSDEIKQAILRSIKAINSIYQTVNLHDEPAERLAGAVVEICKSLCPTQTSNNQSDASTQTD